MKRLTSLFIAAILLGACAQGFNKDAVSHRVRLQPTAQGEAVVVGRTRGVAEITKFLFFTFHDDQYAAGTKSLRGAVERAALQNAIENAHGADGIINPRIVTTEESSFLYTTFTSVVTADAVRVNTAAVPKASFTNLWVLE